jgi:hypothetical protein
MSLLGTAQRDAEIRAALNRPLDRDARHGADDATADPSVHPVVGVAPDGITAAP